jgi:NAD(P)-dependent dehydrogenase (short-subunit alcohol dehydrogenase family)
MGVKVALLDLNRDAAAQVADEIIDGGGTAEAFGCDVLDTTSLEKVRRELKSSWGDPDILINGAGGNHPAGTTDVEFHDPEGGTEPGIKTFFDLEQTGIRKVFDLNFLGSFLPAQVFGKSMVDRGSGGIINISSMNYYTPLTKIPAYAAAKAGIANFTQWLAVHFARTGVRVNAIAPGFLMTEQLKFLHIDQETGEYTPRAKKVLAHTPMGRYGDPEELIGTVIWLLSDAAAFVTGVTVPIDGGFSSYSI